MRVTPRSATPVMTGGEVLAGGKGAMICVDAVGVLVTPDWLVAVTSARTKSPSSANCAA